MPLHDFGDGNGPVAASHPPIPAAWGGNGVVQGPGWLADTATVGPQALIIGSVYGTANVQGFCLVAGSVSGSAELLGPTSGFTVGNQETGLFIGGVVYGSAKVSGVGVVTGEIFGSAVVDMAVPQFGLGHASWIGGHVYGSAQLTGFLSIGGWVSGSAILTNTVELAAGAVGPGYLAIIDDAYVYGNAKLNGPVTIVGPAHVFGNVVITNEGFLNTMFLGGGAYIYGNTVITCSATGYKSADGTVHVPSVFGVGTQVHGNVTILDGAEIFDGPNVYGNVLMDKLAAVFDDVTINGGPH